MPGPSGIKGSKAVIIVKAREETDSDQAGFENIDKEIVFMELSKPVLENLYNVSQVSHTNQFLNKSNTTVIGNWIQHASLTLTVNVSRFMKLISGF